MSPCARSLQALRAAGHLACVVERWIERARVLTEKAPEAVKEALGRLEKAAGRRGEAEVPVR